MIISMTRAYIKPEVKKSDTAAMTTATNESCIRWWDENCYLMESDTFDSGKCEFIKRNFSGVEN